MAAAKGGSGLESLSLPGKLAVGVLFVVLVGVAYFAVFFSDIDTQIESERQLLETKKRELSAAKETLAVYNADREELERRRLLEQKQKKILPDESQSHEFLSSIESVAKISGVDVIGWDPKDEVAEDFYARVPMELTLRGKFHQVAKFFHGVGQVYRIINVENIVLNVTRKKNKDDEDDGATVEVKCLATAFRALKEKEGRKGDRKRRKKR